MPDPHSVDWAQLGSQRHAVPAPRPIRRGDKGVRAPVVRGLVSTRRGSEASGTNAPFWPGACAASSNMLPHSGVGCKGAEGILTGATAMKRLKTSSATNETRGAGPSFAPRESRGGPCLYGGIRHRKLDAGDVKCEGRRKLRLREAGVGEVK